MTSRKRPQGKATRVGSALAAAETREATVDRLAAGTPGLGLEGLVALCAELAARAVSLGIQPSEVADAVARSVGTARCDLPRKGIEVVRLDGRVPVPGYGTDGAVAWDIAHAGEGPVTVEAGRKAMLQSGLRLHIPDPDVGAFLFPRSSSGWRGLALANTTGVIDTDYQGQLLIPVRNTRRRKRLVIEPGERIAQLVFMRVVRYVPDVVEDFTSVTARGSGGFGSTGRS